jgi:hypothetical protein
MQNVGGGPVRMMGHPGPGVMIHEPMQQKMQGGPGQVIIQRPAVNMQQQQHQHMVGFSLNFLSFLCNFNL